MIGPEEVSKQSSGGKCPLRSSLAEHLDRAVWVTDWVALVLTASELRAISPTPSYTLWRFTGIMRIRSCERGCKWKPESSVAEKSSGSLY